MNRPQLYGGRVPVALYLEPEIFEKIEEARGLTSRNAYLSHLVKKAVKMGC